MVQKKLLILFLCLCIAVLSCGLIYALTSVEVTNELETGIVDIRIKEYQNVGGKEVPWEDDPLFLPGDTISKIPRIYNDGNDCYIRVKITFRDTDDLSENNLLGISDKWIKASDGYYYYTEILPHGEDVNIFEALKIPIDYPQENEGKRFYIDLAADAIQSQNFEPRFDLTQPWGEVEIQECGKEGQYDVSTFKQADAQIFSITYQGDVKKLSKSTDDFFVNFPYLMPGDTYSDTLQLVNDGQRDVKLYFRTGAEDESDLLDKIQMKIVTEIAGNTSVFYEGSLRAASLNADVVLGTIPGNTEGTFRFEIHMPHELDNQYTLSESLVQWIFSTEEIPEPIKPQTGNNLIAGNTIILYALIVAIIALIAAVCVYLKIRYAKKVQVQQEKREGKR